MTAPRKAPSGRKHAGCIDHVAHAAGPAGWLCISTNVIDRAWPRHELYRPAAGAEGPYLPAPGGRVTFAEPLGFSNGDTFATFELVKGSTFRAIGADGYRYAGLYRIGSWRERAYTIGA